jgi:uncharacterized protein involved in type VI secretion and phage assembly
VTDELAARYLARSQDKLFGKYRGTVFDRNDPEKLGRLRVRVHGQLGDVITGWAWPVSPYAGAAAGFFFLPNKDDIVWVEFAEGDFEQPLWTGGGWAKPGGTSEVPAEALDGYPERQALRTPSGSVIIFDEKPGSEKIVVRGASGCDVTIDPRAGTITIKAGTVLVHSEGGEPQELATKHFVTEVFDKHQHPSAVGPTGTPLPGTPTLATHPLAVTSVLKAQ